VPLNPFDQFTTAALVFRLAQDGVFGQHSGAFIAARHRASAPPAHWVVPASGRNC
jgi:hypothetical protein